MKVFKLILGCLTFLLGLAMLIFALYFFYEEEDAIICLASLYVSLLISIFILSLGAVWVCSEIESKSKEKRGNTDEK